MTTSVESIHTCAGRWSCRADAVIVRRHTRADTASGAAAHPGLCALRRVKEITAPRYGWSICDANLLALSCALSEDWVLRHLLSPSPVSHPRQSCAENRLVRPCPVGAVGAPTALGTTACATVCPPCARAVRQQTPAQAPPQRGSNRQSTGGRRGPLSVKRTLRLDGGSLHAADSLRPDQASANECVRAFALKTDTGRPLWGIRQKPLQLRRCG
jgi:hypothetical protein